MKMDRRKFIRSTLAAGMTAAVSGMLLSAEVSAKRTTTKKRKDNTMKPMKFFMDTHDRDNKTFPEKITPAHFEGFYAKYEMACYEEGVIPVRLHVGYHDGRAFCLTMAPDAESVKRAHDRVGLPYDTITEIATATPADAFFRRP
jgi:hypothetical protein